MLALFCCRYNHKNKKSPLKRTKNIKKFIKNIDITLILFKLITRQTPAFLKSFIYFYLIFEVKTLIKQGFYKDKIRIKVPQNPLLSLQN